MSIKRIYAKKDCSISNVYSTGFALLNKLSNDGASDSLQIFSIYGRSESDTFEENEKSRILLYFDISEIIEYNNSLIITNNPKYYLKLFHVDHHETTPENLLIEVNPLTYSFNEGRGLDHDNYSDEDEANWVYRTSSNMWVTEGGDYDDNYSYTASIIKDNDNLTVDITELVLLWIDETIPNNGIILRIHEDLEESTESYYKKKFSSRTSEYFFSRPVIEIVDYEYQNNSNNKFCFYSDDSFIFNNSLNYQNIKFGNYYDVDGLNDIKLNIYSDYEKTSLLLSETGSRITTGFYTASFYLTGSNEYIYCDWTSSDDSKLYKSEQLEMFQYDSYYSSFNKYKINIKKMKKTYSKNENVEFKLFIRSLENKQNYYTKFIENENNIIFNNMHFRIRRVIDDLIIFDYDNENDSTKLNWNNDGNYFKFDMSLLQENYMYEISFKNNDHEFNDKFKFKVIK